MQMNLILSQVHFDLSYSLFLILILFSISLSRFFFSLAETLAVSLHYYFFLHFQNSMYLSRRNKMKLVLGKLENILGNGENAGYQHFLLFPQCLQKLSSSVSLKLGIARERVDQISEIGH